jgi:hypothetical protein
VVDDDPEPGADRERLERQLRPHEGERADLAGEVEDRRLTR